MYFLEEEIQLFPMDPSSTFTPRGNGVPSLGADKALEGHSIVHKQYCAPPNALSTPNDGTPLPRGGGGGGKRGSPRH